MFVGALFDFDERMKNFDPSTSTYGFEVREEMENIVNSYSMSINDLITFASGIITRDKSDSMRMEKRLLSQLKNLAATKKDYGLINDLRKVTHESVSDDITESLFDNLEKNPEKTPRNYHSDLCRVCDKSDKPYIKYDSVTEINTDSLNAMLCLYALQSSNMKSKFIFLDCKRSFLPVSTKSYKKPTCHINTIAPPATRHVIKSIFIDSLGYKTMDKDSSLLFHRKYGHALIYRWEVLLFSRQPDLIRDILAEKLEFTSSYKKFNFMGFDFNIGLQSIEFDSQKYVTKKIHGLFDDEQESIANWKIEQPFYHYFLFLVYLYNDDLHSDNWNRMLVISDYPTRRLTSAKTNSWVATLYHISKYYRFDLKFYTTVLSRYTKAPNQVFTASIVNLFKYINHTKNTKIMYTVLPKNTPIWVNVSVSATHRVEFLKSAYSGFIITISEQYWHSDCQLIPFEVPDKSSSVLCAAFEATEYVSEHMDVLKSLGNTCCSKLNFRLITDDEFLFDSLNDVTCRGEMSEHLKSRWESTAKNFKRVFNDLKLVTPEMNPASIMTPVELDEMNKVFNKTELSKIIDRGVPC